MFEPETTVCELQSRLGRVGSIQAWNPWESRKSVAHAKWWVSKVASLSYGNEEAKNPDKLFQSIVDRGHLSCLEFVPRNVVGADGELLALPASSLRAFPESMESGTWNPETAAACSRGYPASAFLVEAPIFVARQWMRHRSFAYLEMSRRYTKGSRVPLEFYGTKRMAMGTRTEDPTGTRGTTPTGSLRNCGKARSASRGKLRWAVPLGSPPPRFTWRLPRSTGGGCVRAGPRRSPAAASPWKP